MSQEPEKSLQQQVLEQPIGEVAGALAEVLPAPEGGKGLHVYRPEAAAAVCWGVAGGKGIRESCREAGVNPATFGYWLLRLPDVEKMYRAARRLAAMSLFDDALGQIKELIKNKKSATASEVRATDVAVTALQKMAEVLNPAEFSNRQPATPPLMVRIETTLNLDPHRGPPPKDSADVYTMARQTMGTVIDVPGGKVSVEGMEGSVSANMTGPLDANAKQRAQRQIARMNTPKTYERSVKPDGGQGEDQD